MRAIHLADSPLVAETRAGRLALLDRGVYDAGMRLCAPTLALLFAGLSAIGCGGSHDAAKKQIEELQDQVGKLRAEQAALAERLERAEIALRTAKPAPAPPPPSPAPVARAADRAADRPDLDVVHLGPEADSDDPDADTPRPVLRASGNSGVIQERAGGKILLDDRRDDSEGSKKKPPSFAKKPASDKSKQP